MRPRKAAGWPSSRAAGCFVGMRSEVALSSSAMSLPARSRSRTESSAATSAMPYPRRDPLSRACCRAHRLVLPEILEPIGRQRGVADGRHDRAVAEIGLDGASVITVVGELEPADVPQHVGMNQEG